MLSFLATWVFLAAGEPVSAPAPEAPRIFANEGSLAVVLGYELAEVSFVAVHCSALERYTQQVLAIPAIPGVVNGVPQAKGRLEIVDLPGQPDVSVRAQAGQVIVSLRLSAPAEAAQRASEAAARTGSVGSLLRPGSR